ncbi:MAG: HlyD family efflux transporter periplasmic adaptor subunit [Lachnospiraceae bacterium]|nr:HlyD family efflux transporter periplasmic adaptor subunit [Lachnospiraceae bacterium]
MDFRNKTSNTKITKYKRYSSVNIGTIIFGIIFVYMIICIVMYITTKHTTSYEVMAGAISGNYTYNALALKKEEVIPATQSGTITYYAREGGKTGAGSAVCSVNEGAAAAGNAADVELTADDITRLKNTMSSFSRGFDSNSYQEIYNLKADLESYVLELQQGTETVGNGILNQCTAPESGFVVYSIDGYENVSESDLSPDMFNQNSYSRENLRLNKTVKAGDNLYKLVTDENWNLYFPLTSSLATELEDRTAIRFRFLKDNNTFSARFSIIQNGTDYYGKISLDNSLIRYVSDRYLDIELLMDRKTGLKIPTSAIAERVFYKIPEDYVIQNSDTSSEITMLRETFNKDGSSSVKYVTATVYSKVGSDYLVSTDLFKEGDYVQMVDTTKKFQIQSSNTETIQGVYNINKGYAIFREVTIIDENEEFCIVEDDNVYGLAAHDHIVLDASAVNADDIVY